MTPPKLTTVTLTSAPAGFSRYRYQEGEYDFTFDRDVPVEGVPQSIADKLTEGLEGFGFDTEDTLKAKAKDAPAATTESASGDS